MKYIKGNLLDLAEQGNFDIIVHGCNCHCVMGSGIANQIRKRYPLAFAVDRLTETGNERKLGKFTKAHIIEENYSFTIINAYTQYNFGRNTINADISAIESVFLQLYYLYDLDLVQPYRIGIPMIGAGLGGLDWKVTEQIIDGIGFRDLTCVIYE